MRQKASQEPAGGQKAGGQATGGHATGRQLGGGPRRIARALPTACVSAKNIHPVGFYGVMLGITLVSAGTPAPLQANPSWASSHAQRAGSSLPSQGHWTALAQAPSPEQTALTLISLTDQAAGNPFGFTRDTSAIDCASTCHVQALMEWEEGAGTDMTANPIWDSQDESGDLYPYNTLETGSMHNLSWKDYEFQLIYHDQTDANAKQCVRCHVPDTALQPLDIAGVRGPNSRSLSAPNLQEGITCVSCHLTPTGEIAGDKAIPQTENQHAVVANELIQDGVELCASCHEDTLYGSLASTTTEHLEQRPDSSVNCISCHMTDYNTGEVTHSFPGGHSPSKLKSALAVTLPTTITTRDNFTAIVKNVGAMHNIPTGEKFRAFVLNVKVVDSKGTAVVQKDVWYSAAVVTPTFVEVVNYNRAEPIAFNASKNVRYGTLGRGTYQVKASLTYYQIKPTTLRSTTSGAIEVVEPFGVQTISTWDYKLTVKAG